MTKGDLEGDVELAKGGDARALERVVRAIRDPVYRLSLRFLCDVGEAEDATQEILLKVVTHLATFRGDSKLLTWVYRVGANHLIAAKQKRARAPVPTFDEIGALLDAGMQAALQQPASSPVDAVLVEEMRLVCTQGMLNALDRDHRLAFVLSDILELASDDAAFVLDIAPDAYRKRVSRARERLVAFMRPRCGVFDAKNLCRCDKQVNHAVKLGIMSGDPELVQLARHAVSASAERKARSADELLGLLDVAAVMQTHPHYAAPEKVLAGLKALFERQQ